MTPIKELIDFLFRAVLMAVYFPSSLMTASLILFYSWILGPTSKLAMRVRGLFAVVTCSPWMLIFGVRLAIQNEHLVYSDVPNRITVHVGTHGSYLDGLAMMVAYFRARGWRHPPCAIVKKEVVFTPFYGIFAYLVGNVLVSRSSSKTAAVSSMSKCADRARQGYVIGAFPEGTRRRARSTGKDHLLPFKKGAFHMVADLKARGDDVEIAPFYLIGSQSAWPAERLVPVRDSKLLLKFCPHVEVTSNDTAESLLLKTRSIIEDGIEESARNKRGEYDVGYAFSQGTEIDLIKEFGLEAVLLTIPPVATVVLGLLGLL